MNKQEIGALLLRLRSEKHMTQRQAAESCISAAAETAFLKYR